MQTGSEDNHREVAAEHGIPLGDGRVAEVDALWAHRAFEGYATGLTELGESPTRHLMALARRDITPKTDFNLPIGLQRGGRQ